jgi:DNA-binding PadR family transcriptional regulator
MPLSDFTSFVEIHILHHASERPVYGLWLIEELGEHGYKISPGTIYPLLHSLEETGLLKSKSALSNGKVRKYYSLTSKGERHLDSAKHQIAELVNEVFNERDLRSLRLLQSKKARR